VLIVTGSRDVDGRFVCESCGCPVVLDDATIARAAAAESGGHETEIACDDCRALRRRPARDAARFRTAVARCDVKPPRLEPPSPKMLAALRRARDGHPPNHGCNSNAERRGRTCTMNALVRRGFVDALFRITDAGRELLAEVSTDG
jgi:hypothetical protein